MSQPKIITMPGVRPDPKLVLARSGQDAKTERMKAVVVLLQWDDGSWSLDWSHMRMSDLCMASQVLQGRVQALLGNGEHVPNSPTHVA